jgi:hypothetical protein
MSWGLICACADPRHPFDPLSEQGALGIVSRCRMYAEPLPAKLRGRGGLCADCASKGHFAAPFHERDVNQRAFGW